MKLSTLSSLVAAHAKGAAAAAVLAAAGTSGGLAVATAASSQTPGTDQVVANASSSHPTTPTVDQTTEAPDQQDQADVQDTATATEAAKPAPTCTATGTWANHGEYVKSVAQATPTDTTAPNAHGMAVSQAAQSSCGKPTQSSGQSEPSDQGTGRPQSLPTQAHANGHATAGSDNATSHPSGPNSHAKGHAAPQASQH